MADNFNADNLDRFKAIVKVTGSSNDTKIVLYHDIAGREMIRDLAPYATVAFSDTDDDLKDLEAYRAACKYLIANRMVVDDDGRERKHTLCIQAQMMWDNYIKDKYVTSEVMVQSAVRHIKSGRKM